MNFSLDSFLKLQLDQSRPLLVGVSGGADSLALLYALNEKVDYLSVCHVDHGWRPESKDEADFVKKVCENLGRPFFLKTLDINFLTGNLEDIGRQERYKFFSSVIEDTGAQAVVLAHHFDDQVETVLKQLFEGSYLPQGMRHLSEIEGVSIWRPFLEVPKAALIKDLEKRGVSWIEDPTNQDSSFLRARMRQELIPFIQKSFGKNVGPPLVRLGSRMERIYDYLYEKISPLLDRYWDEGRKMYNFRHLSLHQVEWDALVYFLNKQHGQPLSYVERERLVQLLEEKNGVKKIGPFEVNRGQVIL